MSTLKSMLVLSLTLLAATAFSPTLESDGRGGIVLSVEEGQALTVSALLLG
jgi:hypothetical protein